MILNQKKRRVMRKIIITDLTRFSEGKADVCMAGIDVENGECIRPLLLSSDGKNRYLTQKECADYKILPGSIIQGDFAKLLKVRLPHREDHNWSNSASAGYCTASEFLSILQNSVANSMEAGFGVQLDNKQKHIDVAEAGNINASIITLRISPNNIRVARNKYDAKKIVVHITDSTGREFSFLSITDFGYYNHIIKNNAGDVELNEINRFIRDQDEVYVRVGLSRYHEVKDIKTGVERKGYWIQVNGIYTFPNYYEQIRSYR